MLVWQWTSSVCLIQFFHQSVKFAMALLRLSNIGKLVRTYRAGGLAAIVENHYGGNYRNMSYEEEAALLEPFSKKAEAGQMVEVSEIEAAYRQAVGHSIGTSQIYYVLHRHEWRKVMPRSQHLKKASDEVVETSKKLTIKSPN